jgi:hypothetical protein
MIFSFYDISTGEEHIIFKFCLRNICGHKSVNMVISVNDVVNGKENVWGGL